ncbi:DUF4873 domain-containing protein [Nonomuraea typhae]|uniref:DUF4873 domain-containing protein n=1 Tax=Nonomuraea typhae TaxID=2603600 RepID=UPI0012F93526
MSVLAYEGPAAVTSGRTQLSLDVRLYVDSEPIANSGGLLRSWRGAADTTEMSCTRGLPSPLLGDVTIRLPDGREALAAITSVAYRDGLAHVTIVGNGAPPFEWPEGTTP